MWVDALSVSESVSLYIDSDANCIKSVQSLEKSLFPREMHSLSAQMDRSESILQAGKHKRRLEKVKYNEEINE